MNRLRRWTWRAVGAAVGLAAAAGVLLVAAPQLAQAAAPLVTTRGDVSILPTTNAATGANTFTSLGTIVLTAGGGEMTAANGIRIEAPAGWSFDTTANGVTYTVTGTGTLRINGATSGTVTATQHEIMLTVSGSSSLGDVLAITGIKVKPDTATTASGDIGISLDGDATVSNGPNDVANATTLTAVEASVMAGTFDRAITVVGVNPAIWNGGTTAQLSSATSAQGGVSVTIFASGKAEVLIPGAPTFVNAGFNAAFSAGVPANTIVLVVK